MCVCLYALQALGRFREGRNDQICLKFDTLIAWVNPCFFVVVVGVVFWGFFVVFSFFENFDF